MKSVKKVIAIIMSVIIVLASVPFAHAASVTPVILVSGFGATTLAQDGEAVFPPSMDKVLEALGFSDDLTLEEVKEGLETWMQDGGDMVHLTSIVSAIVEPIRVNPDGTSAYDVEPIVSGADNTSFAAFKEQDMLNYIPYTGSEFLDMESIAARIGDENVFNFMYDWRKDYGVVADEFKQYIDDVLKLTGAEKVSVYSVSQGSLVVGQYLYIYSHLEQTDKIVFDTPVLGGTTFVADLLTPGGITVNFPVVLALVSDILHTEIDLTGLSSVLESDYITNALNICKEQSILPPLQSCIAFWQLVPIDMFDEKASVLLDEKENEEVIKAVKNFYSGFMGNITETFEKATAHDSEISIKACTGFDLVTDSNEYSDSIVDVQYSTGAVCAPYGETFPADYKQAVNNGKNSISPDRTIDLSSGYWPGRTWVVNGLFHGQVEWCEKSLALVEELLFTDNIKDAYSSYEFPQFMESTSPTSDISMTFVNTNSSFLLLEDGRNEYTMTVTNVSAENSFVINSVDCDNSAVDVDYSFKKALLPGESINITVSANEAMSGKITVSYSDLKNVLETEEKSFGITVLETYSGATAEDGMPKDAYVPFVVKYFWKIINELFSKIKSLF